MTMIYWRCESGHLRMDFHRSFGKIDDVEELRQIKVRPVHHLHCPSRLRRYCHIRLVNAVRARGTRHHIIEANLKDLFQLEYSDVVGHAG